MSTCMSTNNRGTLSWFPFPTHTKGDETSSVPCNKVLFPTVDFVRPGLAFGEFCEACFCEDLFCNGDGVEGGWGRADEGDEFVGVGALGDRQRRH
jgi:hypothetical protein